MSDLLRLRPATTPAMLAVFDDGATIAHALAFEAALARAQAAEGLIAATVAEHIGVVCDELVIDPAALATEAALAGTLAIPLVKRLRAALDRDGAAAVHFGATSQDLADTVLMLQAKAAAALVLHDCRRVTEALAVRAADHATRPALGRTLLQDALPIGFGLRLAQWLSGIDEAARRLARDIDAHAAVQLGGATGTRAKWSGRGEAVADRVAEALGLTPALPWHGRRGGVAAIASSLGIVIGALGKMARDVALLAQNAIGEAREPEVPGRGGSSAMAHKRNPTGCQIALAAATRGPGLVASVLGGMAQEQERGLGGWQAEGPVLAELFMIAGGSAEAMAGVAEGLEIDGVAIDRNLAAAGLGHDVGESSAMVTSILQDFRKTADAVRDTR